MHIFCVTNVSLPYLKKLPVKLAGVGKNKFPRNYTTCLIGKNIQNKEKNYSELTFHYWFWKNKLSNYNNKDWIGFCQKRRFWIKYNKNKIKNFKDLKESIIKTPPKEWKSHESIICKPIRVDLTKKMKLIKRGWRNLLLDPAIFFNRKKRSIKLHFDMHHGYGILEKSINLMNKNDKNEFKKFVNNNYMFNPHIMFISKKKILDRWFRDLFKWLFKCEKIFGTSNLKGYDQERLYAYLAERYLSFWFKKYTNYLEWNWAFYEK
jgi:hypothetical protein